MHLRLVQLIKRKKNHWKIFRTVSVDVIRECRLWFGMSDIKVLVVKRKKKFLMKYANSANGLCQLFGIGALSECYS